MTTTSQHPQIDHVEGPDDDRRPGSIDVAWAERALRAAPADRGRVPRRGRHASRRGRRVVAALLAACALCACVVGLTASSTAAPANHRAGAAAAVRGAETDSATSGLPLALQCAGKTDTARKGGAAVRQSLLPVMPTIDCTAAGATSRTP